MVNRKSIDANPFKLSCPIGQKGHVKMLEDVMEPTAADMAETEAWLYEMVEDDVVATLMSDVFGE